jgi:hypothetical protein
MDSRNSLLGGTGTMVGLASSIFLQNHVRFSVEHPAVVIGLYVATGLLLIFTLVQLRPIQRLFGLQPFEGNKAAPPQTEKDEVSVDKGIAVTGGANGSDFKSIGGDVIGDSAIKAFLEKGRPTPPSPQPAQLPALSSRIAWIDAEFEMGCWSKVRGPTRFTRKLAVCYFENPSRTEIPVRRVEAHLRFLGTVEPVKVNTAYWLNQEGNEITILPAHERVVVIGYFDGPQRFITYENEHSYPCQTGFGPWSCSESIHVDLSGNMFQVEITLMELKHNRRVVTASVDVDVKTGAIRKVDS